MALEVGVIIPIYNRAGLLPATLDSIVSQSHRPTEVVVVDDGSTDDTEHVVRRYGHGVKYVRIENSGQCRARNVGVDATAAPWIAFCDSDDLWHPEKLALQARLFEKAPDVEYGFTNFRFVVEGVWCDKTRFDAFPPEYWRLSKRDVGNDSFVIDTSLFERVLWYQPVYPSTIMMKRTFFEAIGRWKESLGRTLSEDLEFTLRCVDRPPIGVVSAPVVGIRKHASNFSADEVRGVWGEIDILRDVLANSSAANEHGHALSEEIILRSRSAAERAFADGNLDKVRELLRGVPWERRSWQLRLKSAIASSPRSVGYLLRGSTLRIASGIRAVSGRSEGELRGDYRQHPAPRA